MRAAARRFGRKTWSYALGAAAAAARALRGPGARCHPPSGPQSFLQHPFYLDFAYFTKLLSIGIVGNVRGGGRERGALCVERATSVTCGAAAASMSPRASIRAKREKNFRGIKSAARRYGPPEGRAARARAARRAARDFAGRTKSLARTQLFAFPLSARKGHHVFPFVPKSTVCVLFRHFPPAVRRAPRRALQASLLLLPTFASLRLSHASGSPSPGSSSHHSGAFWGSPGPTPQCSPDGLSSPVANGPSRAARVVVPLRGDPARPCIPLVRVSVSPSVRDHRPFTGRL